jgi:hypothetical protein
MAWNCKMQRNKNKIEHTIFINSQEPSRTAHGFPKADHSHFIPWGTMALWASSIILCGESMIVLPSIPYSALLHKMCDLQKSDIR